jgi:MinD superfamily P-loop ATPase
LPYPHLVNDFETYFMHTIDQNTCTLCGGCAAVCPASAVIIRDHESRITDSCTGCGRCAAFCPLGAVSPPAGAEKGSGA